MDSLQQITNGINSVVRFLQSINCIFLQVHWLEQNILRGSNSRIVISMALILCVSYVSLFCSSTVEGFICKSVDPGTIVVFAVFAVIGYFLFKRYSVFNQNSRNPSHSDFMEIPSAVGQPIVAADNPISKSSVSIGRTISPFEVLENGNNK